MQHDVISGFEILRLFVNLSPVRDPRHTDQFRRVVDDVQHAPVTDPDAPLVLVPFQLLASCGPGIVGQRANSVSSSASNSFCADFLISREHLTTRGAALQAAGPALLVRNALSLPARFRHKTVPEVLPDGPVLFQVD